MTYSLDYLFIIEYARYDHVFVKIIWHEIHSIISEPVCFLLL
uniref:Uncharacterized protein n=1 Tax=Meloidogyne enterolobii TaxID=390850 RepID=A0A6V7W549_MELEN|nr:unnamed protein product [Meloidogyne enterolobii]